MPKTTTLKARAIGSAVIAGFIAIMCAGPGTLIVPSVTRLTRPVVCPDGEIEHRRVRYSYHEPGESTVEVECVRAGGGSEEVMGRAILVLFGVYFSSLFLFFFARGAHVNKVERTTGGRLGPLGEETDRELRSLVAQGRRVDAVRRVDEITNGGMQRSQAYVESLGTRAPGVPGDDSGDGPGDSEQPDPVTAMRQLQEMLDAGLITPEEFARKRAEILGRM